MTGALDHREIMAAAEKHKGTADWGDPSFEENLARLVASFNAEVPFDERTAAGFRGAMVHTAVTRLRINEVLAAHPEILDVPVARPLIVTGYPRTGTTILQNLLSLDPHARPLVYWESLDPVPPPEPETFHSDPRLTASAERLAGFYRAFPEWERIHKLTADGPNECENLFAFDFACPMHYAAHDVMGYLHYLFDRDMTPSYRYYKKVLQLLSWKFPGKRWMLKAPMHLPSLRDLLTVFPDACVVVTHRDPKKVIGSLCSLVTASRRLSNPPDTVDPARIGAQHLDFVPMIMDRYAALRREPGMERTFYDVDYRDTVADPVGLIRNIYAHFNLPFDTAFADAIDAYMVAHAKDKYGRHTYDLADFGLSDAGVDAAFRGYTDAFPEIFAKQ